MSIRDEMKAVEERARRNLEPQKELDTELRGLMYLINTLEIGRDHKPGWQVRVDSNFYERYPEYNPEVLESALDRAGVDCDREDLKVDGRPSGVARFLIREEGFKAINRLSRQVNETTHIR